MKFELENSRFSEDWCHQMHFTRNHPDDIEGQRQKYKTNVTTITNSDNRRKKKMITLIKVEDQAQEFVKFQVLQLQLKVPKTCSATF